jgi:predicted RNase H-like HicB family nuclease
MSRTMGFPSDQLLAGSAIITEMKTTHRPPGLSPDWEDHGRITLTYRVPQEGDQFVSICDELGVASCGDSREEALEAVEDATRVYLEALIEEGELARVLEERGLHLTKGEFASAEEEAEVRVHLDETVTRRSVSIPAQAARANFPAVQATRL